MANNFTQNPIILDTAWTSGTMPSAITDATKSAPVFRKIVWVTPTTVGDTVTLTDISGNVLFSETASVVDQDVVLWSEASGRPYTFKTGGWILSQISHGKVYLWK